MRSICGTASLCGRVAMFLPGVPARIRAPKPSMIALMRETLGAKLKRRRLELGLRQRDAAKRMGVCLESVLGWEKGKKTPMASQYPTILSFLGYEPWPLPRTLGEKLLAERRRRGLSAKRAAKSLNVDEGTFAGWERGSRKPTRQSLRICRRFLAS